MRRYGARACLVGGILAVIWRGEVALYINEEAGNNVIVVLSAAGEIYSRWGSIGEGDFFRGIAVLPNGILWYLETRIGGASSSAHVGPVALANASKRGGARPLQAYEGAGDERGRFEMLACRRRNQPHA